jgi:ABC-type transport system involved in multi-copper enzyme maturation permease subunit
MSFLPIVQRELRVAARRASTRYVRAAAAMLGMVIGFFMLLLSLLPGPSRAGAGESMLAVLSWYALLMTLLAGVFLASDSLSEERREGTLGLLFLTDLKGYDVVLGKFMAVSLNAFYGLLAVFPVLALSLLAGGVSVAEFWRTCLALLNLLFCSVAAGMLVSSFCQSSYRAMSGSIALLLTWLAATRIATALGLYEAGQFSPFEPFLLASAANYFRLAPAYWASLAISHLMGWIFLAWASWRVRRFVEKRKTSGVWQRVFTRDLLGGSAVRRARLLEVNPVLWLLDDSRRLRWVAWLLSLGAVAVLIYAWCAGGVTAFTFGARYMTWPFYFLLKVFVAIQACRFFGEARRTGALELLCCTPLTMRAVVQGQWMLLRRVFLWPLIILLSTHLTCLIIGISKAAGMFGRAAGMAGTIRFYFVYAPFLAIPNNLADFFAIGWFGMWLALTMQKPNMAAGLTILCVLILPTIAFCVPALATDAIFIAIGWVKLSEDFRLRQAQWVMLKPSPS